MDSNLRRSRHSVTEWASLARCERLYAWGALGRAPFEARVEALLDDPNSEASKRGTAVHEAVAQERYDEVVQLGFPLLAEWARGRRADEAWRELKFELKLGDEVLVGAMDRIERQGPEYLLLDYKILAQSQKSDADLTEAYRLPMELYAFALGELDPRAQNHTRAILVCATTDSLREIEISLPSYSELRAQAYEHCQRAVGVVNAAGLAPARPGRACRSCRYRPHCVEGRAPLH